MTFYENGKKEIEIYCVNADVDNRTFPTQLKISEKKKLLYVNSVVEELDEAEMMES